MEQTFRDLANYALRHPGTAWLVQDVPLDSVGTGYRQIQIELRTGTHRVHAQTLYCPGRTDEFHLLRMWADLARRVMAEMDGRLQAEHQGHQGQGCTPTRGEG